MRRIHSHATSEKYRSYTQRSTEIAPRIPTRLVAGLGGLSLLVSGYLFVTDVSDTNAESSNPLRNFRSLSSDCIPTETLELTDQAQQQAEALECKAVYEDMDVAIVNYALDEDAAEAIAKSLEARVEDMTARVMNLEVNVITPSDEAIALHAEESPDNCIDYTKEADYGSYIANAVMPELNAYDSIVGLEAMPSCNETVGGVASGGHYRYAEAFNVSDESNPAIVTTIAITTTARSAARGRPGRSSAACSAHCSAARSAAAIRIAAAAAPGRSSAPASARWPDARSIAAAAGTIAAGIAAKA